MKNMNLIINTHWDREYRWSFSETQYRLVEAVDDLLDIMERDPGFAYFHTDSQVSMIDDYLAASLPGPGTPFRRSFWSTARRWCGTSAWATKSPASWARP